MEIRTNRSNHKIDGNTLTGFAAVYNSPTTIRERGKTFTEVIKPGAFRNALASGGDIIATFNHDLNILLGRTSSKTLRLEDTEEGLQYALDLPDTESGRSVKTLVERGDLIGNSFTFGIRKGGEKWNGDTRELTDLYLVEIGPVVSPAYQDAKIHGMRSLDIMRMTIELEEKTNWR